LKNNLNRYDGVNERICFSFADVTEKGQHKIVNLADTKFLLSSQPSDAYFYNDTKKVERQRRLLRLVQMGVQFVRVPSFVRGVFNTFINSMYSNQEKTEGALFGYLEASGQTTEASNIIRQTLNPYLRSDFRVSPTSDLWLNWN